MNKAIVAVIGMTLLTCCRAAPQPMQPVSGPSPQELDEVRSKAVTKCRQEIRAHCGNIADLSRRSICVLKEGRNQHYCASIRSVTADKAVFEEEQEIEKLITVKHNQQQEKSAVFLKPKIDEALRLWDGCLIAGATSLATGPDTADLVVKADFALCYPYQQRFVELKKLLDPSFNQGIVDALIEKIASKYLAIIIATRARPAPSRRPSMPIQRPI